MRIMLDTNILISSILFPNGATAKAFEKCILEHDVVISSYVIDEIKKVVAKKFPNKIEVVDKFLTTLSFDLVYTPDNYPQDLFEIRDRKDYPVLYTSIIENVDILLTGDADFSTIKLEHPEILTPAQFMEKY